MTTMISNLRSVVAAVAVAAVAAGCAKKADEVAKPAVARPITVQLDWVAEPEHGGFYQAEARGYFREAGLAVTLNQGGANANVHRRVAVNEAQFGQTDSTNLLLWVAEGIPLVAVGAVFQNDPSVLMLHSTNPITRFEELNGKTLMARPEWAFLPYLRKKYGIEFNVIPQNFGLGNFVADPEFIQQGFYIAEPYHILKQSDGKVRAKFLYAWDAGFDAITVIVGNRDFVKEQPATTRAFMEAYIRGWTDYITGDPTPAHEAMLRVNPNVTPEFLDFSRKMIIDEKLVIGRDRTDTAAIGRISRERFATQIRQLEELSILPAGKVTPEQVMVEGVVP